MSKYIIGDIHGCYKTFLALIEKIKVDGGNLTDLILVGDLIDRGNNSMEIVQYVIDNNISSVKGNHEEMMIENDRDEYHSNWLHNGGFRTLQSYNGDEIIFELHRKWMEKLPLYLEFSKVINKDNRYLVVSHSNIGAVWDWSPIRRKQMKEQFSNIILWDRNNFEDQETIYNVVGHTPVSVPKITTFFANVDTGCVYNRNPFGMLTALKFPEMVILQQENIE